MSAMAFSHLVDPPRAVEGGVLFTMDTHDLQRTVCVTVAALGKAAPDATTDQARVRHVMMNIAPLTEIARARVSGYHMPELVVIDAADL